jgi:hypothetical protein
MSIYDLNETKQNITVPLLLFIIISTCALYWNFQTDRNMFEKEKQIMYNARVKKECIKNIDRKCNQRITSENDRISCINQIGYCLDLWNRK